MNQFSTIEYNGRTYDFGYLKEALAKAAVSELDTSSTQSPYAVAVVSNDPRKLKLLLDASSQRGLIVEQINPAIFVERYETFTDTKWSYVIVAVDDCGGIGTLFDTLRRFRNGFPATPVILVSADFSRNDFSCERLPLCDISLKSSLSVARLDEAFEAALLNNVRWQMRISDLYPVEEACSFLEEAEENSSPLT